MQKEKMEKLYNRIRIHKQHVHQRECRKIKLSEPLVICGNGHFLVFPFYKLYMDNPIEQRGKEKIDKVIKTFVQ